MKADNDSNFEPIPPCEDGNESARSRWEEREPVFFWVAAWIVLVVGDLLAFAAGSGRSRFYLTISPVWVALFAVFLMTNQLVRMISWHGRRPGAK